MKNEETSNEKEIEKFCRVHFTKKAKTFFYNGVMYKVVKCTIVRVCRKRR